MKKLKTITNELKELVKDAQEEKDSKVLRKMKIRISFLKTCAMYIESKPTDEFIEAEMERINHRIEKINEGYEYWLSVPKEGNLTGRKLLTFYNKEMGVPKLKRNLQALKFLLK